MQQGSTLQERVFRSKSVGLPPESQRGNRPLQHKQWTEEKLECACRAVKKGKSIRRAAIDFGIPKSTVHDHLSGRLKGGSNRYLSNREEADLVNFLIKCSKIGYARSRKQVFSLVQSYLLNVKDLEVHLTNGWWEKFRARHSELSVRTAERLTYARAVSTNQEVMDNYFVMLQHTLTDNKICAPNCIFNCDETGFPLQYKAPRIVTKKGIKHPIAITSNDKSQITVLACVNASGSTIPPMVIFDRKILKPELTHGEVPGTIYGLTSNGWSNSEMFDLWFRNHFLRYIPSIRPILLLMDGHSSHFNPSTIKMAAAQRVIMFCLPPHTTHVAQPLDKSCFSALKASWNEECHQYSIDNNGENVSRFIFSQLFSNAWFKSMTSKNIIAGFRACGVCPLDPSVFQVSFEESDPEATEIGKKFDLTYIPLLTPMKKSRSEGGKTFMRIESTEFGGSDVSDCSEECGDSDSSGSVVSPKLDRVRFLTKESSIDRFFKVPSPPSKQFAPNKQPSAAVLTSVENLERIEEKKRRKDEEEAKKQQRKVDRAVKKQEKADAIAKKKKKPGMLLGVDHSWMCDIFICTHTYTHSS